ncbi:DUF3017 domain-containing protein [Georgenia muralis]|uniref:DUF3017 family protein n=1 Tax=Georgenia muralis TaxID=154117 RepID=A0A3N4Z2Y4_9MICO|nr:DUF3017 domain-containing protein [Georgenia muralis]RPF27609.1 DUF3017 family protein [Georgenia muralis]
MSPARGPRLTLLAVLVLAVALVALVAVWSDARTAALVLAGLLAAVAVARVVLPEALVPGSRSRPVDVVLLLALAGALVYLAPWGNATLALP